MGRASWSVQRRLSEIFEAEVGPLSTLELAARLYEVENMEVTDAQLSSVRRALNALARKGVLVGHQADNGRIACWSTPAAQRALIAGADDTST